MKKLVALSALCAMLCLSVSAAIADAGKEVTVKGTLVCAKCELHQTASCQNALKVTHDGKDFVFLLAKNDVSTKYHDNVCQSPKADVTVTGTVSEQGGKKIITASKIE